jgi:hypothetical protein
VVGRSIAVWIGVFVGNSESFANLFLQQAKRKHDLGEDALKSVKPTVPPV